MGYLGEIRMFAGNFAPAGWRFCEGQLLPIADNTQLFQLIGTTYGGDGESTFALPDLRGRIPLHQGNGFILAETGGAETITLTVNQIPVHNHAFVATTAAGTQNNGTNALLASSPSVTVLVNDVPDTNLAANALGPVGGSQPHNNLQPYLCIDFIISMLGSFPSQT